jgi:hypothetical protein
MPGLRVNFGAPGDRTDADGNIWYAYPRPVAYGRCLGSQPYGPKPAGPRLPIEEQEAEPSCETWGRNPDWVRITETDKPWLQSCGLGGQIHLVIRRPQELRDADALRVVLYFCELDEPSSSRVFDIGLQGKTVLQNFNVAEAAGGTRKAVAKPFTLQNTDTIELELTPSGPSDPPPTISGMAITAE